MTVTKNQHTLVTSENQDMPFNKMLVSDIWLRKMDAGAFNQFLKEWNSGISTRLTFLQECINMIICILINPKILVFHKFSMYFFICSHYVQWKGLRSSFGEFILLNLWWDFLVKIHTTVSWLTYDPFCWLHEKYFKVRRINGKDLEGNLIHSYGGGALPPFVTSPNQLNFHIKILKERYEKPSSCTTSLY